MSAEAIKTEGTKKRTASGGGMGIAVFLLMTAGVPIIAYCLLAGTWRSSDYVLTIGIETFSAAMSAAVIVYLIAAGKELPWSEAAVPLIVCASLVIMLLLVKAAVADLQYDMLVQVLAYAESLVSALVGSFGLSAANILLGRPVKQGIINIALFAMLGLSVLTIVGAAYYILHVMRLAVLVAMYAVVSYRAEKQKVHGVNIIVFGLIWLISCDCISVFSTLDPAYESGSVTTTAFFAGCVVFFSLAMLQMLLGTSRKLKGYAHSDKRVEEAEQELATAREEWAKRSDAYEERIAQLEREVSSGNEKHKQFVRDVSHEFRIPISIIKGYGDTLLAGLVNDEDTKLVYIRKICLKAEHLNNLITALTQTTKKPDASTLHLAPVDICRILNDIVYDYTLQAGARGIRLNLMLPEHQLTMELDELRITQSVSNIMENSLKYMGRPGTISVTAGEVEDGSVMLVIRDDGVGITQEEADKIFDRGFRGENKGIASGSGLGLSFAKETVELHGGKIWAKSERDKGMSTYIILPIKK